MTADKLGKTKYQQRNASAPSSWRPICQHSGCERITQQGGRYCFQHVRAMRIPKGERCVAWISYRGIHKIRQCLKAAEVGYCLEHKPKKRWTFGG